jgi:FKBP-type peptidyl-prolyl cis-trans isomerase FkpA
MRYLAVCFALLASPALAQTPGPAAKPAHAPSTSPAESWSDDEKTIYALGRSLGERVSVYSLSPREREVLQRGLQDALAGQRAAVDMGSYGPRIPTLGKARIAARSEVERQKGAAFADTAARQPGAVRTASGLVFQELAAGSGEPPTATGAVQVLYKGTLIDGRMFDSSLDRAQPAQVTLGGVIKCWSEGLQMMRPGGKARLVCPSTLAYGDASVGTIPPGATLVFEVELVGVLKTTP